MNVGELGPDERAYWNQGRLVCERGPIAGLRVSAARFLDDADASAYPSPLRWLWVWLVSVAGRHRNLPSVASAMIIPFVAAWALSPVVVGASWASVALAASSPLLLICGRRALQDSAVALAVIAAAGAATHGSVVGFGLGLFVCLALKEAAVLYIPALTVAAWLLGSDPVAIVIATSSALAAWALSTRVILGHSALAVFRSAAKGHDTPYSREHQSGGVPRLVLDMMLVSPALLFVAGSAGYVYAIAMCALVAHALSPVQNVRTLLAADIAIRVAIASAIGWWVLPLIAIDALVSYRFRSVYDPVTSELMRAYGMAPRETQAC